MIGNLTLALSDAAAAGSPLFGRRRRIFWIIAAAALSILAAAFAIPALADIFDIAWPGARLAAITVIIAVVAGGWFAVVKALDRGHRPAARPV